MRVYMSKCLADYLFSVIPCLHLISLDLSILYIGKIANPVVHVILPNPVVHVRLQSPVVNSLFAKPSGPRPTASTFCVYFVRSLLDP